MATYTWRKEQLLSRIAASRPLDAYALFREAPADVRSDRQVFQRALERAGPDWAHALLGSAPQEVREDRELLLRALEVSADWRVKDIYALAPAKLRSDREVLLRALQRSCGSYSDRLLKSASQALRDDKEVVLLAVTANAFALQHASLHLQNDQDVIDAATHGPALCDDGSPASGRSALRPNRSDNQIAIEEKLGTKAIRYDSLGTLDNAVSLRYALGSGSCVSEFGVSKRRFSAGLLGTEARVHWPCGEDVLKAANGRPSPDDHQLCSRRICMPDDVKSDEDLTNTADPPIVPDVGCPQCHACARGG